MEELPAWIPPEEERRLGLGFYATQTAGIGGVLKERPDAFRVQELSHSPLPDPDGAYTVLRVRSQDWEQHELSERIAQRLGLAPHALSWAGTKDRRAVAERLASYRGPLPGPEFSLPGVELIEAYRARDGLVLGHHFGNAFELLVSGAEEGAERIPRTAESLRSLGGIPNLFGPQRFGEVRPVTHRVGQSIVRGEVDEAVDRYLTDPVGSTEGRGDLARRAFAEHRDPARALREFPPEFRFERVLLDHLARGNSAARALRALSRELRTLFVHAFQSVLFNRFLTARVAEGLPIGEPIEGDHVLRVARDGTVPGRSPVPVLADNLSEVRAAVSTGRAVVAGPLIGYETPRIPGRPGELVERLLAEEGVTRESFRTPATPDLASAGTFRPLQIPVPPISWSRDADRAAGGSAAPRTEGWWFRFALPKGAYATVVMREFRKERAVVEGSGSLEDAAPLVSKRAY